MLRLLAQPVRIGNTRRSHRASAFVFIFGFCGVWQPGCERAIFGKRLFAVLFIILADKGLCLVESQNLSRCMYKAESGELPLLPQLWHLVFVVRD